jgi:hypothetical protein
LTVWNLLVYVWSVVVWLLLVAWQHVYFIAGAVGMLRIVWHAFQEGRRYQMRRVRELLARVREGKQELPAATEIDGGDE